MAELQFDILSATAVPYAMAPEIDFQIQVENNSPLQVDAIVGQCQIRIQSTKRSYNKAQVSLLSEIFGAEKSFARNLKELHWTNQPFTMTGFETQGTLSLKLPCSFDYMLAITKYFHSFDESETVPIVFLFSGTIFYRSAEQTMVVKPISWNCEAQYLFPVSVLKELRDNYYPGQVFLALSQMNFDKLYEFKRANSLLSWDQVIERLLSGVEAL